MVDFVNRLGGLSYLRQSLRNRNISMKFLIGEVRFCRFSGKIVGPPFTATNLRRPVNYTWTPITTVVLSPGRPGARRMVRLEGFEPPTLGSVDRCSNPLSYSRFGTGSPS